MLRVSKLADYGTVVMASWRANRIAIHSAAEMADARSASRRRR